MQFSTSIKALKYIILIIIAYLIFRYVNKNISEISKIIKSFQLIYVAPMIIISITYNFLTSLRLYFLIDKNKFKINSWMCFKIFITGKFMNMIIPQGGNIYRAAQFKKVCKLPITGYVYTITAYTWFNFIVTFLITLIILYIGNYSVRISYFDIKIWLLIFISSGILMPIILMKTLNFINFSKYPRLDKYHKKIINIYSEFINIIKKPVLIIKFSFITILSFVIVSIFFILSYKCINVDLSIFGAATFASFLKISSSIIITPGNMGAQEFVYGFLSTYFGITMATGLIAAGIIRVITSLVVFSFGIFFGVKDNIFRSIREHE